MDLRRAGKGCRWEGQGQKRVFKERMVVPLRHVCILKEMIQDRRRN